ncbi:MAG TPA: glycosyl hydrolase family 65 protein [Acidimicrobiia bacterium]
MGDSPLLGPDGDVSWKDPWVLAYDAYDPAQELLREALCTLGNGRFATRGAVPECPAVDGRHYPGTYVAGVYNRLTDEISGRRVENESLVNLPNWLPVAFRVEDDEWFSIDEVEILFFRQALEMHRGILSREVRFVDGSGRETSLAQRRLVHMSRPSMATIETSVRPENWGGRLTVRSHVDGGIRNRNVDRYRSLSDRHLEFIDRWTAGTETHCLRVRTTQSRIEVVAGVRHRSWLDGEPASPARDPIADDDVIGEELTFEVEAGSELRVEKVASIITSRDVAISEPGLAVVEDLQCAPDFPLLEEEHTKAWMSLWNRYRVELDADVEIHQATNFHIFHLLQVAAPNVIELDVGIPARGLHGEAYRGHVFWDELFVFPMLHVRSPEVARSLLDYRHRRLPAARRAAAAAGYEGAMFPWQSGSDGREETQEVHLNPRSGRWHPDLSRRQRHLNLAIAYNVVQYLRFTGDVEFLARRGAEMLIAISRFWSSIATYERIDDRYEIVGVMGPDEFHDDDPNWEGSGLRNNAYTNVMTSWLLSVVPGILDSLPQRQREDVFERFALTHAEKASWDEMSRKLKVPFHDDGIISQFEGYGDLEELDWAGYRRRYDNIERLDRILEAEGDSVNRYKASKQADLLMLFYLLSFEELVTVFGRLGVEFDEAMLTRSIDYYMERTSHGSTLSRLVHSWVLARSDRRQSLELFREALQSDLDDIQGGTTKEGIHLGAMAGTVDLLQRGYSGMEAGVDGVLRFKPSLDPEIERLEFSVYYHGRWVDVTVAGEDVTLTSEVTTRHPIQVECRGQRAELASGEVRSFRGDD